MSTLVPHVARKAHRCDGYFVTRCPHGGSIAKGATFYTPSDDCKDPYHPFRICENCAADHAEAETQKWAEEGERAKAVQP